MWVQVPPPAHNIFNLISFYLKSDPPLQLVKMKEKTKIIVIVGPTATGKSDLAIKIAKRFNGEIISADSRQVYRGLDIGSGKVSEEDMGGIKHHLLDVADPKDTFTVAQYKELAESAIKEITEKEKLPIICGGTGFYIQTVVDSQTFPEVPPNPELRTRLEEKTTEQLAEYLKKIDHDRYEVIDKRNRPRLIRAIEIAEVLGKVPPIKKDDSDLEPLFIGIDLPDELLREKIGKRLRNRIDQGMIEEVEELHKEGLTWERLEDFGLEYKVVAEYLQEKISTEEIVSKLELETWQFAKRQRTWFKRDKRIKWFMPSEWEKIEGVVDGFLG